VQTPLRYFSLVVVGTSIAVYTTRQQLMKTIILIIRVIGLIAIHFICFTLISAALFPSPPKELTAAEAGAALTAMLVVSVLSTIVLSYVIIRSRYARWHLFLAIFVVLYGVMTVMPQIETAYFVKLPSGMLSRLFLFGAVFATVFSFLAVVVLGKTKPEGNSNESRSRLKMPTSEWLVKLSIIVMAYLVFYFTFGYFIAWKSEAVRAYYGGSDPGSFLAQMNSVLRDTPWLVPLQIVRAILWTAIAAVVIQMMKGRWWEAGLAVALLVSVVMCVQLLLPNPLMPTEVRMVHLIETASSNFIFGWLIVMVLLRWKSTRRVTV
jgi:hypothetical protein